MSNFEIRRLKRSEINDFHWNRFIERTEQNSIYAKTWFLDAIPQVWEALIAHENSTLVGVLPYQTTRKYGIKKVEQDAFVNELGILHLTNRSDCCQPLLDKFFKMKFISMYRFNVDNYFFSTNESSFETAFHLNLNKPIGSIRECYKKNLARNIEKARKCNLNIVKSNEIESLIQLFKSNVAQKIGTIEEYQYDILRGLKEKLFKRGKAFIYQALSENNTLLSAALVIRSGRRIVYYFGASNEEGKKLNSQAFLLDHIIEKFSDSNLIFDFEGGNTNGLRRFYSSFGSFETRIPVYRRMLGEQFYARRNSLFGNRSIQLELSNKH